MELLYPWALAAAALVALPVLLHLRRRGRAHRVSFPALRYLDRALETRDRSLRASHLLLLAVRALLLLALAAAAAGPLLGRGEASDHRPTDLALVVDNTASTRRVGGGGPLLATLLDRGRDALDAARPEDRVWVVPLVGPVAAAGATPGEARAALDRVEATDAAGDPLEGARRAAALLVPRPGRAREVHLLSDLQASGFGERAGDAPDPPPLVVLRPPGEEEAPNDAVVALEVPPALSAGQPGAVVARTRRPGDGERAPLRLRLEVDGATAAAAEAPRGERASLGLPATLGPGAHAGRVEVEPSGLRADDARHFTLRVAPPPVVALGGPGDGFLTRAVETLAAAGRIRRAGGGAAPAGVEVAVLEGVPAGPPPPAARDLVLVPPADPVRLPAFDGWLEREGIPWRLAPDTGAGELGLEGPAAEQVPGLDAVRVSARHRLRPVGAGAADDEVLLRTSDGEPWLVRGADEGGRRGYLLVASPLAAEASDLPTSAAMIPWAEAVLLRWPGGAGPAVPDVDVGRAVALPPRAASVRTPDGGVRPVEGGSPFVPLRAGVHAVRLRPEAVAGGPGGPAAAERERDSVLFAANVPPAESDLARLPEDRLPELWRGGEVIMAGPEPGSWRDAAFRSRRGSDASPWLLALALFLAGAEAALAAPGRRRSKTPGSPIGDHGAGFQHL